MVSVEFGLIVPAQAPDRSGRPHSLDDVNRLLTAVTGPYASAWWIDHLTEDILEGWTALTYLSALHPALQWGHTVLCQSFRNPALLARMGATLQLMSGGRFVLGLGAGGDEADYRTCGYPFPSGGARVLELEETLHIIKAIWTQEHASYDGTRHRIHDVQCRFRPDPLPPIMIGAFGPKMLRLTAQHADWWNVSSTGIAAYRSLVQTFERACVEVNRNPATVRQVWSGGCVCAPTEGKVGQLAAARYQVGEDLVGTPAQILAQLEPFIDLGVDCFLLDCGGFPDMTTVETLIAEVLPSLNGTSRTPDRAIWTPPSSP